MTKPTTEAPAKPKRVSPLERVEAEFEAFRVRAAGDLSAAQAQIGIERERADAIDADRKALKAQNDALRDEAYSANMELARMRGYIEGLRDGEPPQMIPEPREHPLAKFRDTSNDASVRSWTDKRRWYHAN